jgi:hypothetical protein
MIDWSENLPSQYVTTPTRGKPDTWQAGHFAHPHDACLDHDDNIYVIA